MEIYQKFQSGVVIASYRMRHNQIITITSWVSFLLISRFANGFMASLAPPSHHHISGYKIARNRRSERDSPFTCCYRGRLCNIRINREKISEENPKPAKNEGGTYLKLQTHLLEQRQKKQYY